MRAATQFSFVFPNVEYFDVLLRERAPVRGVATRHAEPLCRYDMPILATREADVHVADSGMARKATGHPARVRRSLPDLQVVVLTIATEAYPQLLLDNEVGRTLPDERRK